MTQNDENKEGCPCGSDKTLAACCGRYLEGGEPVPTAEALMRSRYTAYVLGNIDYIVDTFHPDKVGEVDRESISAWSEGSTWHGLEVLSTDKGGPEDDEGEVEFIAYYDSPGGNAAHHERASFSKVDGIWRFVDGEMVKSEPIRRDHPKVGRNDPCPCSSGKKYKKCCGK